QTIQCHWNAPETIRAPAAVLTSTSLPETGGGGPPHGAVPLPHPPRGRLPRAAPPPRGGAAAVPAGVPPPPGDVVGPCGSWRYRALPLDLGESALPTRVALLWTPFACATE